MKNKTLITIGSLTVVALVTYVIGKQILKAFNMSLFDIDFKYQEANHTKRWVDFMTPLAKDVGSQYGIPWQFIVMQTALETSWGKSSLFLKYNNYGGIKAVGTQQSVSLGTTECNSGGCSATTGKFAVFPSKYEGLIGYAKFFHNNGRYKTALQFPNDPYRFATEIAKAGYATAPNYAGTIQSMIQKYLA